MLTHVLTVLTCLRLLTMDGCRRITLFPTDGTMTRLGNLCDRRLNRLRAVVLIRLGTTFAFHTTVGMIAVVFTLRAPHLIAR